MKIRLAALILAIASLTSRAAEPVKLETCCGSTARGACLSALEGKAVSWSWGGKLPGRLFSLVCPDGGTLIEVRVSDPRPDGEIASREDWKLIGTVKGSGSSRYLDASRLQPD